jgi:CubicO group peptidase (beta-lactamase class C family)
MQVNPARRFYGAALLTAAVVVPFLAPAPSAAAEPTSAAVDAVMNHAMKTYFLKGAIVQVRSNGTTVYTGTYGESMTGVPPAADMHFRNGALAFTYMATLLLEFVDQKKTTLDTKLSTYLPDIPNADKVTLKNLANMTSGYPDYVYQPATLQGTALDPYRQWTPQELVRIGLSGQPMFPPGSNWGYCHTNYVLLGMALAKIAGMPLDEAIQKYVLDPMGLKNTRAYTTPEIPAPVLHVFDSERRSTLGVKPDVPFYEESTFWNPSWTTIEGAVETTDVTDLSISIEAAATGKLLSPSSSQAQIAPNLIGFSHPVPGCGACRPQTTAFSYGLGVFLLGPWISQSLGFAGASGATAYLPSQKLTISLEVTNAPDAYDGKGDAKYGLPAGNVLKDLADALAPNTFPKEH